MFDRQSKLALVTGTERRPLARGNPAELVQKFFQQITLFVIKLPDVITAEITTSHV